MDISPSNSTQQPISDDQELAKALAGVMPDVAVPDQPQPTAGLQFEETPAPVAAPAADDLSAFIPEVPTAPADTGDLDAVRKDAINELRPLIDKVDLPAEEKFDTYLLLIRSTDDPSLIAPAHAAAQNITDEKRKAEALLDVIKEIDYLKNQPAA